MRAKQPHIRCSPGDISKYCIIVGDPGRVLRVSKELKDVKEVSDNRGLPVINGFYDNIPVTVACTGMGGPSAAIVIEELINCGAKVIIRVGSGGVLRKEINTGDLIISTGVCKEENASLAYVPSGFASVPDFDVTNALISSAKDFVKKFYYGITMCTDGFYAESHKERMLEWSKMGVIGSEMESSMLFTLATLRGVKAGLIFYAGLNFIKGQLVQNIIKQEQDRLKGESLAIMVALNAIKKISGGD